jgi:predicted DNA-binding protein
MKRTTVLFPEQMIRRLKAANKKTGISVSEIIRAAIDAYLKAMNL